MRYIIAGAPCSGKTTYVQERVRPGDLVYDYDLLHQALSGQASHQHLDVIRPYVLAARDGALAQLEAHKKQSAWLVTSTHSADKLRKMRDRFEAEIVFLPTDQNEAHRRCDMDRRPAEWHQYIDRWFEASDIDPREFKAFGGDDMERKTYRAAVEFKADADKTGEFRAEFATLNVIDHDGDVTEVGAFRDGQETLIEAWNHNYGVLPVGKGIIREKDDKAIIEGAFFVETQGGLEHYKVVKALGPLQEWSYTFNIENSALGQFEDQDVQFLRKLDVWGVAPVQRGAGIDTRTLDIKGRKPYPNEHACRLRDPRDFQSDSFRRVSREHDGKTYGVIMGRLTGETTMTEQAYRYPTAGWSESQAKSHCKDHEGRFEAATEKRLRVLREYLEEFGERGDGKGEIEDEAVPAGDGKSREKPGEIIATRITLDMIEYGLEGPKEGP